MARAMSPGWSRRSFLGRLGQLILGYCGLRSWSAWAEEPGSGEQSASKMQTTVHQLFAFADPEEMSGDASAIAGRIRQAFPYLKLDPDGLAAFANDLVLYRDAGELRTPFLGLKERFLLSSSFFDDGADEGKVVEYVAFHDPYVTPCSNRLAVLLPSPEQAASQGASRDNTR